MERIQALLVVRTDAAVAFRDAINAAMPNAREHITPVRCRRTTDAVGTLTHYAAHGAIPASAWPSVLSALTSATQGIRDGATWQGDSLAAATWGRATDGGDIVAAFYRTDIGNLHPRDVLDTAGLVKMAQDEGV